MRITFDQACERSGGEFEALRGSAPSLEAFDQATESMRAQRWSCDTNSGTTRNREGVQAQFVCYDWGETYEAFPSHVFYDFFRGSLLNKVSRIQRGLTGESPRVTQCVHWEDAGF